MLKPSIQAGQGKDLCAGMSHGMSLGVMLLAVQHDVKANPNASALLCDADFLVSAYPNVMQMNRIKIWYVYL